MKYYCIGIKGSGMSTLAQILYDLGNEVSGYDDARGWKYTEDGLNGIHRLSVAFFSEDLNVCLPIKSSYDDEKKEVYTEVSRTGTYCLMDVKKWAESLETNSNKKESQTENGAEKTGQNSSLKYGHSYYGGHTYALITEKMNWESAKEFCENSGGHLLTINNEFEQINYCILMADKLGVDPKQIVLDKIEKNAKKYPIDKAKGVSTKYNKL